MAISGFLRGAVKYSEDPEQAIRGELLESLVALTFTAAGFTSAAAGDLPLGPGAGVPAAIAIPKGNWRIRTDLSRVQCPQGTASATLDLGLAAYVKADGTTQSLNGNQLANALAVGAGAIDTLLSAVAPQDVNSRDGVQLVASVATANSPATGRLIVNLVLQKLPLP